MKNEEPKQDSGSADGARRVQLVRDPRDLREMTTDTLGLPLDAGLNEVSEAPRPKSGDADVLSRRKREQAWESFKDPVERLAEEAFLYPMEPLPGPDDHNFPIYQPVLPPLPELHSAEMAFSKLLDAVASMVEPPAGVPEPQLRVGDEPDEIDLPPPPLPKRWD